MIILGIETSCDETAAAVAQGRGERAEILSDLVASQVKIHEKYGGVVPEVAAREHAVKIIPVIDQALKQAGIKRGQAAWRLDAIAVTIGPGLITSLIVGVETAKALAYGWNLPVVAINHIEGHIYANFICINAKSGILDPEQIQNPKSKIQNIFPALIITVSGGHTMLVLMKGHGRYETIGDTRDDAAGEAFDKAASMLNIGYPGGPAIAAVAAKYPISNIQYPIKFQTSINLPRPMINNKDFDFSFSGLKTALLYALKKDKDWKKRIPGYAYEFQEAVTDVLVYKTIKAAEKYGVKTVMLAGGVSANKRLREKMSAAVSNKLPGVEFKIPFFKYTTDNAAMIAAAGCFRARRKDFTPWPKLRAAANSELR